MSAICKHGKALTRDLGIAGCSICWGAAIKWWLDWVQGEYFRLESTQQAKP
jgi:hypothetical protein